MSLAEIITEGLQVRWWHLTWDLDHENTSSTCRQSIPGRKENQCQCQALRQEGAWWVYDLWGKMGEAELREGGGRWQGEVREWRWWFCRSVVADWLSAIPWAAAHQTPLSMEFSRQEYWSGLPFPTPGDLPDPGIKLRSPHCRQMRGGVQRAIQVGKKPLEDAIMEWYSQFPFSFYFYFFSFGIQGL